MNIIKQIELSPNSTDKNKNFDISDYLDHSKFNLPAECYIKENIGW